MNSLDNDDIKLQVIEMSSTYSGRKIARHFGISKSSVNDFLARNTYKDWWIDYDERINAGIVNKPLGPKILTFDIEISPNRAAVWGLFKQNVGLNMIEKDWYVLSWAAKWFHEDEVMYQDKRDSWDTEDDLELLQGIWELLDEADIVITQNGIRFDEKKLNARFVINGMQPPSSFKHIDTLVIAKKHFGFTSNKLEYMTNTLCKKYKKLSHGNYPGYTLWEQCLKGNQDAWIEMEDYNKFDVLSLEELYTILRPYFKSHPNINLYYDDNTVRCKCGGTEFEHDGYAYTNLSKFDRFRCQSCGGEVRGRVNLLSEEKRRSLRMNVL